jgi:hypothetical protein
MVSKVEEKCGLRHKIKKYGITEIFYGISLISPTHGRN